MLGRSFILLALSACPLFVSGVPAPGSPDYQPADYSANGKPKTRSLDFGISLNLAGLNVSLSGARMIDLDQARASYKFSLFTGGETNHTSTSETEEKRDGGIQNVDVTIVGVLYTASVGLGTPATQYNLLIDTGSANTWVGSGQNYTQTSSSVNTGMNVSVGYGSGGFKGVECALFLLIFYWWIGGRRIRKNGSLKRLYFWVDTDVLTLSDSLVVTNQSIGVATTSTGFSDYDGILGLAPVALTKNTVDGVDIVPTVSNNLASQGTISSEIVGISFAPTTTEPNANGVMTFGGPGEELYEGEIEYVGITSESPASEFWGIDLGLTYGESNQSILNQASGIVDTGSESASIT